MEKKINLVESPVVFDQEHHTYDLYGQQLSGVTPIISWLFPDTYAGIPAAVLDAAAEYGSLIHSKCELYDSLGILPSDETQPVITDYKRICEAKGLRIMCSEYLVSDERYVASCIDKVCEDMSLCDIKTTSKLHVLNVTIQLSIYAWLFERQNFIKVPHLYAIWLPKPQYGMAEVRELERIPADFCERLVVGYALGQDPKPFVEELSMMGFREQKRVEGEIPEEVQPLVAELMVVKKQLDLLQDREKEIKAAILAGMQHHGEQKWSNDLIQFSVRAASERVSVDTTALKKNEPALYEKYKKVTKVAESLTYKVL